MKVSLEKKSQLNPKYEYKEETPMRKKKRKNGDEQIPSEGEYSKLSKVCSPLSLGSRGGNAENPGTGFFLSYFPFI